MKKLTTKDFIEKAKVIHGDRYDYSKVKYENSHSRVKIICKIHGEFEQLAYAHLQGKGCPKCKSRKNVKSQKTHKNPGFAKILNCFNQLGIKVELNNRKILDPFEIDVWFPEYKLGLEFNGTFWHSEKFKKRNFHQQKKLTAIEKGIELIHIHEWLFEKKEDQFLNMILNRLNFVEKIFARKCEIKEIDSKQTNEFLNKNHLQGGGGANVRLGLFYSNRLISVMTFLKPRFNKNYKWELMRFASDANFRVLGGAGKLLKYFERNYIQKGDKLLSYANLDWSSGLVYKKLGFTQINISEPNYVWWKKNCDTIPRYQAQKHKLKDLLKNFDPNKSERELMQENGWVRFFDSGNLVFEKLY